MNYVDILLNQLKDFVSVTESKINTLEASTARFELREYTLALYASVQEAKAEIVYLEKGLRPLFLFLCALSVAGNSAGVKPTLARSGRQKGEDTMKNNLKNEVNEAIINAAAAIAMERARRINATLKDAAGSQRSGFYGSALECAAQAVDEYIEIIDMLADTKPGNPLRPVLLDAVGSVDLELFELPASLKAALDEKLEKARKGLKW